MKQIKTTRQIIALNKFVESDAMPLPAALSIPCRSLRKIDYFAHSGPSSLRDTRMSKRDETGYDDAGAVSSQPRNRPLHRDTLPAKRHDAFASKAGAKSPSAFAFRIRLPMSCSMTASSSAKLSMT